MTVAVMSAAVYQVGPNQQYARPCQLAPIVKDGDVVEIAGATAVVDDSCLWNAPNLTLRSVGAGKARIAGSGTVQLLWDQALWNFGSSATNFTVDGFEFTGAKNGDGTGSGIRLQPGSWGTIRHCYFHDNEQGVQTSDSPAGVLVIEENEFARNGSGNKLSHNVYVNHFEKLIFARNRSHDAVLGSLIKSRAAESHILYNVLRKGPAIYAVDLPEGGLAYVVGNVLWQDGDADNSAILNFGREVALRAGSKLVLMHNTFDQQRVAGEFIKSDQASICVIENNIFTGIAAPLTCGTAPALAGNYVGANPGFVDQPGGDYHLAADSPAIDQGVLSTAYNGAIQAPLGGYRAMVGAASDAGAYERGASDAVLTWTVSGGRLPAGLTLAETGIVAGVPTEEGIFDVTITASAPGAVVSKPFRITVKPKPITLGIRTATLPEAQAGNGYLAALEATIQ